MYRKTRSFLLAAFVGGRSSSVVPKGSSKINGVINLVRLAEQESSLVQYVSNSFLLLLKEIENKGTSDALGEAAG